MGEINGVALGSIAAGAIFVYGGIVGKSPLGALRAVVQGSSPSSAPDVTVIPQIPPGQPPSFGPDAANPGTQSGLVGLGGSVVDYAKSQIGKPYSWNTPASMSDPNPKSFDCSGLTMCAYYHAYGIALVHFTGAQYLQLKHRPMAQAQPGDLIFFGSLGNIHHVGIYVGGQTMIDAPTEGVPVGYRNINEGDNLPLVGYHG